MIAAGCRRIGYMVLVLFLLFCSAAHATEGETYLKGYVQALLDQDFPSLDVTITDVESTGRITLSSDHCVPDWLQKQVERSLTKNNQITDVSWSVQCQPGEANAPAPQPDKVETLPKTKLFTPLLADPRTPRFSANYEHEKTDSQSFNAGAVSFGEDFGFARGDFYSGRYQFGVEGGVFALFNLDTASHDLENADYMIGLPVTYRRNAWSYRARVYHISSHLGDEFLLRNPNVKRINLSYEVVEALASWEHSGLRLYGGGGSFFDTDPHLDPWQVHYGVEYRIPRIIGDYNFDVGADFKQSQTQGWIVNQSYVAGLSFRRGDRLIRFLLEYYKGLSPNGQFFTEHLHYYGFGIQLGF